MRDAVQCKVVQSKFTDPQRSEHTLAQRACAGRSESDAQKWPELIHCHNIGANSNHGKANALTKSREPGRKGKGKGNDTTDKDTCQDKGPHKRVVMCFRTLASVATVESMDTDKKIAVRHP